jgi:SAM-dependent methyltransferase
MTFTMIDEAARMSFDRNALRYEAARPSYPDALGRALAARAPGRALVEIGAGTGKATEMLARAGFAITALEPGASLAAVLRAKRLANVTIVETTFETWRGEDGGFDVVAAAQAIHWIDPAVRYAKAGALLRPGGVIAVIRNDAEGWEPSLRAELDAAYARWLPSEVYTIESRSREYVDEIARSGLFGTPEVELFPWRARYTTRAYLELIATYSDHALLSDSSRAALLGEIAVAIDRRGGEIEVPYVAMLVVAQRG